MSNTADNTGKNIWLILGASSPIARAFALAVAAEGNETILAGRDKEDLARLAADIAVRSQQASSCMFFDARAFDTHEAFVQDVRDVAKDKVLNIFFACGVMPNQEEAARFFDIARTAIETNYLGGVSILSRLAPIMEAQKSGHVVVIGSVAGDRGRRSNYLYGSTKAALQTWAQGFGARLFQSGVFLTTVKPGFTDTSMMWANKPSGLTASAEKSAQAILKAVHRKKEIIYVPWFWRFIMLILCFMPERIFKRLSI